jgi:hypothetical protein
MAHGAVDETPDTVHFVSLVVAGGCFPLHFELLCSFVCGFVCSFVFSLVLIPGFEVIVKPPLGLRVMGRQVMPDEKLAEAALLCFNF